MAATGFANTALGARLRLLRFSNFPSPVADVLAGVAIARHHAQDALFPGRGPLALNPGVLLASLTASICIYHAGMIGNDVADRSEDTKTRPGRPIPSGAVSPGEATALMVILTIVAAGASYFAGNWRVILPLAAVVYIYNFVAKRGNWAGPFLLGTARGLNLFAAIVAFDYDTPDYYPSALYCDGNNVFLAVAGYGIAIAGLSIFAINEDRPFSKIRSSVGGLLTVVGASLTFRSLWEPVWSLAWIPFVEPLSVVFGPPRPWTPDRVGQLVGAGLRSTMIWNAIICYSCGQPGFAALCGAGYLFARILARWIPPT